MTELRPLVCVFLKLPPSHRSVLRIHEIAWNVFLPQLKRLNDAFEATQVTHASPEAKKIWLEMRRISAEKMDKLESIAFMNHSTAFGFLEFLDALHTGRDGSEAYNNFRGDSYRIFNEAGQAQDVLLKFREDIRVAVGRITTILSKDNDDISSFVTESSQSLLELATGVEECNALLEEHREEVKEVQRQSFDEKDNRPSEEEFQMVREKWQAFMEISEPPVYAWEALRREMGGCDDKGNPNLAPYNPTNSTTPTDSDSSKSHKISFWRKFFRRILSCLSMKKFVR
ncbi:hypothetical protein AGABI2DRAFT_193967 [Agaricus bisporus var. bisporus H97]|uniref:hypothetical protein n=1 Tax=Agaricus bisporus var. bisporus (strain H97 / ATCC MYA-4626 / FGSC 10389) TaxID=936046 RepID=UPI00029F7AE9|nr:hypothetical protein AGABI2DRAFT_193967 [Agaricus bisporus var. bisporus H97]EKV46074.1 hypothetical protein AGABI2DRAFT_193967 [Agaricus bisporus var. bisporus H97]